MSIINASPLLGAGADGYQINQSLRFRGGDTNTSINLSRTNSVDGTGQGRISTFSCWYKKARFGNTAGGHAQNIFGASDQSSSLMLSTTSDDRFELSGYSNNPRYIRDPGAWYHVVVVIDTTIPDGSAGPSYVNRQKVYVNNELITGWSVSGPLSYNYQTYWGRNTTHTLGDIAWTAIRPRPLGGYLAEAYFVDGQALTPSSFGETDAITGAWIPKRYSGSYGTNGFYLKFDPSATNGIGHDHSGNGNNFTATGFQTSTTSSADYDCMTDSPTNNYATLNPIFRGLYDMTSSIINGGLTMSRGEWASSLATTPAMAPGTGTYYWECYANSDTYVGIVDATAASTLKDLANPSLTAGTAVFRANGNNAYVDNTTFSSVPTWTGQWAGFTYDSTNYTLRLDCSGGNYTLNLSSYSMAGKPVHILVSAYSSQNHLNFGQKPFSRTRPSGSKVSSTKDLPEPTIKKGSTYFNAVTYSGSSSNQAITVGFEPDFLWIKRRNGANDHNLYNAIVGLTGNYLVSNSTGAENSNNSRIVATSSTGFTVGTGSADTNGSGNTYVAWAWDANGAGSTNTAGSITSTVSANATAGFSIVTYTGAGSNGTVGHGLGVAPKCVIVKNRSSSTAYNWYVWHSGLTSASYFMNLNRSDNSETFSNDPFGGTAPTSTVFTVGGENRVSSVNYVAYCFSEVSGYSRIGTYVGNSSSDGPYVNCGFKPAWVMVRARSSGSNWTIYDNKRQAAYNPTQTSLNAASTNVDGNLYDIDLLSNGFKLRTSDSQPNYNGWTYIFIAFAEHSFKYANAR